MESVWKLGWGFPSSLDGKASACNVGDPTSVPGLGRSPRVGNGNPLQYSCLDNSMDRGAWWATVHGVVKSCTRLTIPHQDQGVNTPDRVTAGSYRRPYSVLLGQSESMCTIEG